MNIKTWLTGLKEVQSAINNISNLGTAFNGGTNLFADSTLVTQYANQLKGLTLQQAELALSTKILTNEQRQQILAEAGLIATENTIQADLLQTTLAQAGLNEEKKKAILIQLGLMEKQTNEILTQNACTKAELENMLALHGVTGAQAENIISTLGLSSANETATVSFGLLTKAIWANIKALGKWLITNPVGLVILAAGAIAGIVAIVDSLTVSLDEAKESLSNLKDECKSIESDLSSMNDELKTTVDRMNELENKDKLSFTEKEEYDNLVKTNNELERKIALLELEQKIKNKETNKAFVQTMEKDIDDWDEYSEDQTGKYKKGYTHFDEEMGNGARSEADYIKYQFKQRQKLLDNFVNAETEAERERIQEKIDKIDQYLSYRNDQFNSYADGIEYIQNPSTEDDKAVNEWLDYINDFQDKMAIAMGGDKAKTLAFNRLVDNWKFDDVVQELQNLGKQGQVTADMLNDPKYDEFIQKLVELGVIDSADNLDLIALAFNNFGSSFLDTGEKVENTTDSIDKLKQATEELQTAFDDTFSNQSTLQSAFDKIQEGTSLSADEVRKLINLCKESYPEIATAFTKTADGYTISADDIISANEAITKSTKEEIQNQIDEYQKIIDTYNKNKLSPLVNNPSGMPSYVSSMYANLAQLASDAEEAQKQIDFLNLVLQMFGFTAEETASTSIDKLSSIKSIIKDFKEEIDDGGKLTISTLQKAIEKYPQLENSLSEYLAGLKSQEDIYDELVDCYNQDLENFKTYLANKSIDDENTWDKFVENSGDWVNSLADMYALDLAHLKTYKQFSDELKNSISNNIPDSTAALAHYQNLERQSFEEFKGLFGDVEDIISESRDNSSSSSVTLPEEYTKLKKALEHEYAMGRKTAKEYYTELNSLAVKWLKGNAEYADEYMSVQETVYSGLKSLYSEVINEQIEGYENVLDVLKNINQEKIDSLNKEKELLEDNADEEQRILDLKKAQLDLENAKKRTTWVITEQGLKQVQDEKSVKEAQDALDKLELESKTSQIDKKIKALEDENNKYDKIKTDWQNKTNLEEAKKFIGSDNIKGAVSEGFKEGYINALNEKQSIENADKSTNKVSNPVTIDDFLKKLGSKYTFDEIKDKAYNLAFSPYAFNSFVENIKTTTDNIVNNINNNNSSKIGDINIVINDATDPEKVGNVVVEKLTDIATKWSNSSGRYLRSNY